MPAAVLLIPLYTMHVCSFVPWGKVLHWMRLMFLYSNTFLGLAFGCRLTVLYGVRWGRGCGGRAGTMFWELRSNLPLVKCTEYVCQHKACLLGYLYSCIGLNARNFWNLWPHSKREGGSSEVICIMREVKMQQLRIHNETHFIYWWTYGCVC